MQKAPQNTKSIWKASILIWLWSPKVNGLRLSMVSDCQWSPTVNGLRMSIVSECQWSLNVNGLWMATVSECQMYLSVIGLRMATVSNWQQPPNGNGLQLAMVFNWQVSKWQWSIHELHLSILLYNKTSKKLPYDVTWCQPISRRRYDAPICTSAAVSRILLRPRPWNWLRS